MEDADIERLRNQLKLLQRRLRREGLPAEGVSRSAVSVLAAVTVAAGDVNPRKLATRLEMTSSNVAAALRELETAGLVIRAKDPLDGRKVRIQVTKRGRAVNARRRSERHSWFGRAILAQLDEREQQLLRTAGELIERIAGYGGVPPDS
jgi:DNA-binding MarR family transcriptional regulator